MKNIKTQLINEVRAMKTKIDKYSKITKVEKTKLRTWVELDRYAIKKNFELFKNLLNKKTILMAVVKSNAYGHDILLFSKELVKLGIKFLGVDSFEEALELREVGVKISILVFGYVSPLYYKQASEKDISITISNMVALESLKKILDNKIQLPNILKIHIKVDTGLGRQGFLINEIDKVLEFLEKNKIKKNIEIEGLYSHLALGENLKGKDYTILQVDRLNIWHEFFKKFGFSPLKHICATSSTMFFREFHFDMVRIGIGMYGFWPSKETKLAMQKKYTLHPVLSWKTIITEIKNLPKGAKIGYDLTEELKKDSTLAIIPVGYWHGYPRALSSIGLFWVNGKIVKLLGRVSMDMIVLDITGIEAKVGDKVFIIDGQQKSADKHFVNADQMAESSGTINYEIVTRINPEIKRIMK